MKSSDDENGVKLKLTCGAVMDEENVYFDMFDLYIDCTETFIKGCDLLTKPKMEGLRSMLFVHSIWGGDGVEEKLSAGPFYLIEYFAEDDEDDAPKTLFNPIYVEEYSKIGCRRTHVLRGQAGCSYLQAAVLLRSNLLHYRF